MAESEEELKGLLMRVKQESDRAGLRLNIKEHGNQLHYCRASRRGKGGSSEFSSSWAPKSLRTVTVAMKLKDTFSLEEKAMTNLDIILKIRDIALSTKVHLVKAMVFPVVMYRWESWTVKMAEHQRIDILNCDVEEDSWESHRLQGDPINQS